MASDRCVAVAQDPGGAEALAPVLKALADAGWTLMVLARRQACQVFERAGIAYSSCDEARLVSADECAGVALRRFEEHPPQLVLTATSLEAGWERGFIRAANQQHIPCVTIVDGWSNARARFLEPGEVELTEHAIPHRVTAVDDEMASDLCQAGVPQARVRVVGQPALEQFVRWAGSEAASQARQQLRQSLQISEATRLFAFFSQPIAAMSAHGSVGQRGYDQFQVLGLVQAALAPLQERAQLIVKLHPKEQPWTQEAATPGDIAAVVQDARHGDELIVAADVVVGMASMALVKAALAGRRILSIQPGLQGPDPFVLTRRGWLKTISNAPELTQALRALDDSASPWSNPIGLPAVWTDGQATLRIAHVISELLGRSLHPSVMSDAHPAVATA